MTPYTPSVMVENIEVEYEHITLRVVNDVDEKKSTILKLKCFLGHLALNLVAWVVDLNLNCLQTCSSCSFCVTLF